MLKQNLNSDGEFKPVTYQSHRNQLKAKYVILAILILLGLGLGFWFLFKKSTNFNTKQLLPQKFSPELKKFIKPRTGERWYDNPKTITAQAWLKTEKYSATKRSQFDQPLYQEVGRRGDASIVLVASRQEHPDSDYFLFERYNDGRVKLIIQPNQQLKIDTNYVTRLESLLDLEKVVLDQTIHYDSLSLPAELMVAQDERAQRPANDFLGRQINTQDLDIVLVSQLGRSALYRLGAKNIDSGLINFGYFIKLPFGNYLELSYQPHPTSLADYNFRLEQNIKLKFNDEWDQLAPLNRGCGAVLGSLVKADKLNEADLVLIGENKLGQKVFGLKDKNHQLYQQLYAEYKTSTGADALSFEAYFAQHAIIAMLNQNQEVIIYVREAYAPVQACGKPVIYLYPESATKVAVEVGADFSLTDPLYPSGGWRDVWAEPSGRLTYRSKNYDYLFWEGTGHGQYPQIKQGVLVPQVEVLDHLKQQLKTLGLNRKESADFLGYWQDKIPKTKFVRLTWFGTDELETLAPLRISPQPDTLIRVFLDMAGFDQTFALPKQTLKSIPRRGFTVVEWGGLVQHN